MKIRSIAPERWNDKIGSVQTLLAVCFLLTFAGRLAAQSEIRPDQCLGGWVVSIQPDSLTLKFNDKITIVRLAPGAEIWRRGKDLDSLQQFVVGDEIYTRCTREPDGSVVASIVAAVEENDGAVMEPHRIVEITVCAGRLIAIAKDSLTLKNDKGGCIARIPANTEIWRGETFHDTNALRLGDELGIRCTVSYPGRLPHRRNCGSECRQSRGHGRRSASGPNSRQTGSGPRSNDGSPGQPHQIRSEPEGGATWRHRNGDRPPPPPAFSARYDRNGRRAPVA